MDDLDGARTLDEDTVTSEVDEETSEPCAAIEAYVGWGAALDAEAQRLRAATREFLADAWLPRATELFTKGELPREIFQGLGRAGALGASLVGRGGFRPPASKLATCAVMHAIEHTDGGLRCAATIQDCVIQALVRFGDAAQRGEWLEQLVEGERIASFALTEPEAGSDLRAVSTTAVRRGGDWSISGRKGWVTNAPIADVLLVWARTSERNDAIRGFLIERGARGLETPPITGAASMRGALVGQVILDDVRVPSGALLPHAWGLADINACLDYNRLTVAFGVMGAARFCLEEAIRHARARRQFGVALGAKQLVQGQLADMAMQLAAGELLSLDAARRWCSAPLPSFDVSLLKRHNCRAALEIARAARALLGAAGVDLDRHVVRHLLNLEASYTYGGTNEIHGLVMGKTLTGLHAF